MCQNSLSLWAPGDASKWRLGITQLLEAAFYAVDCGSATWQFAIEIANLHACGLTINDLRWLLSKGYIEHAIEMGPDLQWGPRKFRRGKSPRFERRSCVVLTDLGIPFAQKLCQPKEDDGRADPPAPPLSTSADADVPRWDAAGRLLWLGSTLVKKFTVPAPNQELILSVFDADSWPSCINDPLPLSENIDPKRRLHDTITRLNQSHASPLIHFAGNGTGHGVRWVRIASSQ
jgi:hypothetical protein